jgi:hypothetical protein
VELGQFLRHADDGAMVHRVATWPPRDEDAAELGTYEERYRRVRGDSSGQREVGIS